MRPMPDSSTAPQGERFLDLRGLDPPAPLMRVFEALDAAPDLPLRARFPREPFPLYPMLQAGGWTRRTVARDDGSYDVLISKKA
jgi:hypothetical protein